MSKRIFMRPWLAVIVVAGTIGVAGGTAYAFTSTNPDAPAGVASEVSGDPRWPTNASGQTYGSLEDAKSPDDAPDLIEALTTDSKLGYLNRVELDAATGANVSNPAEALAWNESRAGGETIQIPVYAQDGRTVIGSFRIDRAQTFTNPG